MRPHTTAFMGMWRGLPTAGGRGTQLSLLPALARQCRKGTVQLWFTKSDDEPTSFTLVGSEADLTLQWMMAGLPDHLIGLEEEGRGNREAKGLGSLE